MLATVGPAHAQSRPAASAAPAGRSEPRLQHTFPLAGHELLIVVDGLTPGEIVALYLFEAAEAPPSVTRYVTNPESPGNRGQSETVQEGALITFWSADDLGRVVLNIELNDPADVDRDIHLQAQRLPSGLSEKLSLHVEPPMLVLQGPSGLQRISLLTGAALQPAIPGTGGLRGLALSDTGTQGYLLRDGGRLEVLAARQWDAPPLAVRTLDPASDVLAARNGGGCAFVLARPDGEPFAPAASLLFLEGEHQPVVLEPMDQPVSGHRVALTDDGLTAFVAEDDLIVREVDLQTGTARGLITAGLAGDRFITDVILAAGASWSPRAGRSGGTERSRSSTSIQAPSTRSRCPWIRCGSWRWNMASCWSCPAAGGAFQVLEGGVLTRRGVAPGVTSWLDAVASENGALLLAADSNGRRSLLHFDPLTGALSVRLDGAPPANRLAGTGPVVLLGDPAGKVHVFDLASGKLTTLADVTAAPDAPFVVLP